MPDNWELVRRDTNGNEKVLAANVASYDISPDGTVSIPMAAVYLC